jgi:hypothetical protein
VIRELNEVIARKHGHVYGNMSKSIQESLELWIKTTRRELEEEKHDDDKNE